MGLFDRVKSAIGGDDSGEPEAAEETGESDAFGLPSSRLEELVSIEARSKIIHESYERVDNQQAKLIARKLKQEMEAGGFSQREIRTDLEDEVDLPSELLETIVWTETTSVQLLNTISSYSNRGRPDHEYKIVVPDDDRTHQICREASAEIEQREGVSLEELQRIWTEKAEEFKDEGGTPDRMEHWVPHERCRATVTRHIDM